MAGTKDGSIKSFKKIDALYGSDHFAKIGALGGASSTRGGFWYKKLVLGDTESIRRAGMLGGRVSRRGKYKLSEKERCEIRKAYIN